jgi:Glycosyltransferase WbsX
MSKCEAAPESQYIAKCQAVVDARALTICLLRSSLHPSLLVLRETSGGEGFDKWSLLKKLEGNRIRRPLAVESGGLGYYDLMNVNDRKRQADLARKAGVSGFVHYHYW